MRLDNMRIALSGLLANRMRSLLTMLGILIGVGAVIVLVAVGTGSSCAVQKQHRKVVVLGTTVVTDLFGAGVNPIDKIVRFGSAQFRVVGVLKSKGTNGFQDQDDVAYAPISAVQDSLTGVSANVNGVTIEARSSKVTDAAQAEVLAVLASDHKLTTTQVSSTFRVHNQADALQTAQASNQVLTVLLGAV